MKTLQERRLRSLHLREYLRELSSIVLRPVSSDQLTSTNTVLEIQANGTKWSHQPSTKFELEFKDLNSPRMRAFWAELSRRNESRLYLMTGRSVYCGALGMESLMEVDLGMDFGSTLEGVIAIVTADLENSVLLDFHESPQGERSVVVTVQGTQWIEVGY
jgi:hypothetical protein